MSAVKTAYCVLGHGSEEPAKYVNVPKVPKGCTLIVKSHSGNSVSSSEYFPLISKFIDQKNRKTVLDPLGNKAALKSIFDSVAIYTEGDDYPEFLYSTLFIFDKENPVTRIELSGILKLDDTPVEQGLINNTNYLIGFTKVLKTEKEQANISKIDRILLVQRDKNIKVFDEENKLSKEFIDKLNEVNIPSLYKYSNTYGFTEEHIRLHISYLVRRWAESYKNTGQTLFDFIQDFKDSIKISQSRIFQLVEEGTIAPGVFYNFSCRGTSKELRNITGHIKEELRIRPVGTMLSEIKDQISEAELHRKELIHEYNEVADHTPVNISKAKKDKYFILFCILLGILPNRPMLTKSSLLTILSQMKDLEKSFPTIKHFMKDMLIEQLKQDREANLKLLNSANHLNELKLVKMESFNNTPRKRLNINKEILSDIEGGNWANVDWIKEYSLNKHGFGIGHSSKLNLEGNTEKELRTLRLNKISEIEHASISGGRRKTRKYKKTRKH